MFRTVLSALFVAVLVLSCSYREGNVKNIPASSVVECPARISWDVTSSAEVTRFACYVGEFKGKKMLIYEVAVKNVSDAPKRFRVAILNPSGKSVGGLIPRKGKPPVLKPGQVKSFKYPVVGYTSVPEELNVFIMEVK